MPAVTLVAGFEVMLVFMAAAIALKLVARRLRVPPAAALIVGGAVLALVPGIPAIELDPDLILTLVLPPLLLAGAYLTSWRAFRTDLRIILQLAVGAVLFTTLVVGWIAHWLMPGLPWAACFALGAIVSPPDAVAARAVLQGLPLPKRAATLLEGESLVNDATGLVLYRFAVASALTGTFDGMQAVASFGLLAVGGILIGTASGWLASTASSRIDDAELSVAISLLAAWGSYIIAEHLNASGVLSTVACGIVMGWRQHALLRAEVRIRTRAVWDTVTFVLETLVFILIGLSLQGVLHRLLGGSSERLWDLVPQSALIVTTVILARFAWIISTAYLVRALIPTLRKRDPYPPIGIPIVLSWAGMRGVVSLAAAVALPEAFPGRDFILATTFTVIVVTVLLQGSTLAPLIRLLRLSEKADRPTPHLSEREARLRIASAELAAVRKRSALPDGSERHPRLVEQYTYKVEAIGRVNTANGSPGSERADHFGTVLAGVNAGRAELLKLHRSAAIDDVVLHTLESELDSNEILARLRRGPA